MGLSLFLTDLYCPILSTWDNYLMENNNIKITGIDEVGRGSLAGPIVSASCTFSQSFLKTLLNLTNKLLKQKLSDGLSSVALAKGGSVNQTVRLKKLLENDLDYILIDNKNTLHAKYKHKMADEENEPVHNFPNCIKAI